MKKYFLLFCLLANLMAIADEGMWLPQLVGKQRYADMKAKGLKLTAEQLWSINKSSIKDAIIIFDKGCTGEIVSAEGLIFTNHHCGYDAIAEASTVTSNYLKNGFYAKSKADEIPATGITVQFLVKIDDVTSQVNDSIKNYPNWADWMSNRDSVFSRIGRAATAGSHYEGKVYSMFKDNQFLLYTFERFKDVRLVGTPPESIGFFGGDTDNWEWPRHTGDFSIFRVYADANGKPAEYNQNNVPLKSKYFLPISLKGVKEGDFAMTLGYPGSTNRFETSYGVKLATDIKNPAFVKMREIRLKAMMEEMKKDEAAKLKLSAEHASLANYWKFYDGETKQLLKYDVAGIKKKNEEALMAWIKTSNKPEYAGLFDKYNRAYQAWQPYAMQKEYYEQGITGPSAIKFANRLEEVERALTKGGADAKKLLAPLSKSRDSLLENMVKASEQKMLAQILQAFYTDIQPDQHPVMFYNLVKQSFGSLKEADTYNKWTGAAYANSMLMDNAKWQAFMINPDAGTLQNDPLYYTAKQFRDNWNKFKPQLTAFNNATAELGRTYVKAYMEANPTKVMYPDANFSMRLSYGAVKSYAPRDAVKYDYVTTAKGLLEKYKPGDYEFDLSARQLELLKAKDYGMYADPVRKELVVAYITTNDITGGNSGSPVINGNGELIGLAFDGNYEAISHKINFDKEMTRTICIDIRYLLWCVDKLGGASNIIKELKLVR
jgi:hypothetical protein